jgi:hypothetical protein
MLKLGVRPRIPVLARALLLLVLVIGVSGMHSLGAGDSGMGTASGTATTSSASTPVATTVSAAGTDLASWGAVVTQSAPHSMGHDCVAVLTDAPGVALGPLLPNAALSGEVLDGDPASALSEVRAALDCGPLRPAPSLSELSILRV